MLGTVVKCKFNFILEVLILTFSGGLYFDFFFLLEVLILIFFSSPGGFKGEPAKWRRNTKSLE